MDNLVKRLAGMALVTLSWMTSASGAVIVDSISGEPLPGVSVFDRKGNVAGISSDKGVTPYLPASDYPLTVSCVGYRAATIPSPTDATVKLQEIFYHLPEVTVDINKKNILHITGYVREYSTLTTYTDTVMLFREKKIDFMVPGRRTKGYRGWLTPRIIASKSYYRFTDSEGNDSVSDRFGLHFSWSDWVGIVRRSEIPLRLRDVRSATDTVFGRYSPAAIWRRSDDNMSLYVDILADTTNLQWAPGLKSFMRSDMEFTGFKMRYNFDDVGGSELLPENISRISFNIESNGRGRNYFGSFRLGERYCVNTYAEVYLTDKKYITVGDAKRLEKHPRELLGADIQAPEQAPELQPSIKELITRVDNIDPDSLTLAIRPDEHLIGKYYYKKGKPRGIKKLVKKFRKKFGF